MADFNSIAGVLSGCAVGFSLGLIGGGGSVLATPLLLYVVGAQPHVAIGTSAFAVSVNAYVGFLSHARARTVRWRAAVLFASIGIIGATFGSSLGKALDGRRLITLFAVAMVGVGVGMLRIGKRQDAQTCRQEEKAGGAVDLRVASLAFLTGFAAGFFGIGGGIFVVPALMLATGMEMVNAVGSSLLAVGTLGLTTAINYAASGMIDWKLALEFIAGGLVGAFSGMRVAVHLGANKAALRRVFAAVILVVAGYVIFRSHVESLATAHVRSSMSKSKY
ncbi:sulfite exporter TauE/SafE family protein [uncultured Methylovirgula sp.]|uniref:sulfite exporter TauE/SafE family protein n=1 Tax=uncultured Methylovirgula sp. TaxID=1285960 RepID=UPI00260FCCCD|nr:sulfite exporter TauE/SafE family protein [uncultured Methylovirgula sp.]